MARKMLIGLAFLVIVLCIHFAVGLALADTSGLSGVDVSWYSWPRQVYSTVSNDCTDLTLTAYNSNPTAMLVTMRVELDNRQTGGRIVSRLLQGAVPANGIADWQVTNTAGHTSTWCGYDADSYAALVTVLEVTPTTSRARFQTYLDDGR